eukprot:CAMPEP_0198689144 /NCGR_PEP_ID=MMETSP1468-20131203/130760_1 /TAXON_ID=1461545 /ORGANISM="Mantoniella sp, Strain CCMP1436" /LENGTH=50 /DNA_ID=CAMNT_0044439827 /DNA_START=91 /DNA_END=240 /DNA_ORIENTATION=+
MSISAPDPTSTDTAAVWPSCAAINKGVKPPADLLFILAPAFKRTAMTAAW